MKYTLLINQQKAVALGMNPTQAIILDVINGAQTWAEPLVIKNNVYFWVSRHKVCEELPILNLKPDTVYRHFTFLESLGVIDYGKVGKKDCVRLTEVGKSYFSSSFANSSEINPNPEIDPNESGNESEQTTDSDPTYKTTIHKTTIHTKEFRDLYPKKTTKFEVERWFMQHRPGETLFAEIIQGLNNAMVSDKWRRGFVPDPINFLKKKLWLDEHEAEPVSMDPQALADKKRQDRIDREIEAQRKKQIEDAKQATDSERAKQKISEIKRRKKS